MIILVPWLVGSKSSMLLHKQLLISVTFKNEYMLALPWWLSSRESSCQCRRLGFAPWSKKIPQAEEQLSPWAAALVPELWSPGTAPSEAANLCDSDYLLKDQKIVWYLTKRCTSAWQLNISHKYIPQWANYEARSRRDSGHRHQAVVIWGVGCRQLVLDRED